ncbi:MAG TPA: hypothetical protein VKS44_08185 [Candidatus Acidoferrales bacterium]|nr:hypothetical protein [Candidatus Acidoferrales bacterium]
MQQNSKITRCKSSMLATAIIAALMLVVGAPRVRADNQLEKCRHNTEKAEAKLDRAITEHGEHSHEAAERMEDLRKQREHCYERLHQWWDGRDQSWHRNDDFGDDLHHRGDHDHDHDHPDSK